MKQGKLKIIGATVILVAVIFGVIFFGINQNFDNNDIETANKPTAKVSASKKTDNQKTNKSRKAPDKSLYLQDTEKPDRILAIHPHGTDGVYQYRKSADGSIYPEQEFFKGNVSLKGNNISVQPTDNQSSAKGFNLKKKSNGKVVDEDSGHLYNGFTIKKNDISNKPKTDHVLRQPQHNRDYVDNSTGPRDVAYMLENGDFYNPYRNTYYGPGDGYKSFDPTLFNAHKYDDAYDIMAGNQNGQTEIAAKNIEEQKNWSIAIHYPHKLSD